MQIPPGYPARFSTSWPHFRPKNVISHTGFRTWWWSQNATLHVYITRNYVNIAEIKTATKRFLKIHFELHFLSYSFGIETTNTLVHKRGSSVNYTRFQTKMGNIRSQHLYLFSDQNGAKTIPFHSFKTAHTYMAYIREYPPGPLSFQVQRTFSVKPARHLPKVDACRFSVMISTRPG